MIVNNYTFYLKEFPLKLWTILAPHNRSSLDCRWFVMEAYPNKKRFLSQSLQFFVAKSQFCCQKGCTEYTLYPLLLWLQLSLNEMKRPVTPRLLSDTMEQLLEWGRTSPWAMTLVTLLGLVSCLRIAFGLLKNLRDLIWAYILPRIWPVDLVKTYGK